MTTGKVESPGVLVRLYKTVLTRLGTLARYVMCNVCQGVSIAKGFYACMYNTFSVEYHLHCLFIC